MGKIKKELRVYVWNKFNKRCAYCGCVLEYNKMQIDHITPIFRKTTNEQLKYSGRKKGLNELSNYNPSCSGCNYSKSTFTLDKWRDELYLKKQRLVNQSSTFRILMRFGIVKFTNKDVVFEFEKHELKNQ